MTQQERFDALRAKYLAAREALHAVEIEVSVRYGGTTTWASRGEKSKLEQLRGRVSRAGDAFFEHLQAISPRDWSSGVPFVWCCESLTYADAVRPVKEPLSVVPPLPYGATVPFP